MFGSHFAPAMDVLFTAAERRGLNITAGLVRQRPDPARGPAAPTGDARWRRAADLIERWHGQGRLRYAVTPRFSLSASDEMLDVCARAAAGTAADDVWFTSHINENLAEVADRAPSCSPGPRHYLDTYHRHGLVTERSVFAHNVHASDAELDLMGEAGAWAAHCPTSNSALGSGLFPLRRHVEHGVGVALGSDVGRGHRAFPAQGGRCRPTSCSSCSAPTGCR